MCTRASLPNYDSANLTHPSQQDMVNGMLSDQKVSKLNICYNASVALLGVALLAFCVSVFVLSFESYGWVLKMAPLYSMLGVAVLGSFTLTIFSTKRMIELCIKKQRFDREDSL